jgi:hypothetical protein
MFNVQCSMFVERFEDLGLKKGTLRAATVILGR